MRDGYGYAQSIDCFPVNTHLRNLRPSIALGAARLSSPQALSLPKGNLWIKDVTRNGTTPAPRPDEAPGTNP